MREQRCGCIETVNRKLLPRLHLTAGKKLSEQIYEFLRMQIVKRQIPPGTALSENELAAHFDVSRNPIREAIGRLRNNHLIEIMPQKGTFVTKISISNLKDICFVRGALETAAVRNIPNLTEKEFSAVIKALDKNMAQQRKQQSCKTENSSRFLELDDEFHRIICDLSKTSLSWQMIHSVKANMDRVRYLSLSHVTTVSELSQCHEKIYEAIAARNIEKACELIEKHSYEITRTYKQIMEESSEDWFEETEN